MKKKIVYIAPHLSTGGMPQYLVKQIELIKDDCEVYCVEWGDVTGGVLVVQRNKMVNLLGDRLITLGENKHELFDVIDKLKPDIIHLQEIPELFMDSSVADKLYIPNRTYAIIETSHDSGYNTDNKIYLPDKFLMVSNYQKNAYKKFDIPCDVVEYPIENKVRTKTREQALRDLGLDPNLKHVINVGLFTPRKNQAEIIEYARQLQNYPIQFHFIGNQADNFRFYWEPLMKDFPSNCKWWNERSDVDAFYEAADLFLFTSRGHSTDMETMPLVIRESLSWKTPSMIYNLPVYMGYFDKYDTIEYLTEDLQKNAYRIAEKLLQTGTDIINIQKKNNVDDVLKNRRMSFYDDCGGVNQLHGLYDMIKEHFHPHFKMAEVGSFEGQSTELFALHCNHVYSIDPYEPYPEIDTQFIMNAERTFMEMKERYSNITKIRKRSLDAVNEFEDNSLDAVYIDAAHDYENVKADILAWLPKVKPGGVIAGHDYAGGLSAGIEDIKRAVSEIFPGHVVYPYKDSSWAIKKGNLKTPLKEIYIVSTYPNTEEKERLLNITVNGLKSIGKDVLIVSHYPVADYIVEKADYYIFDKNNTLDTTRTLENNGPDYWRNESGFRLETIFVNHTLPLSRIFSIGMDFAKNLGYEYFVILESDSEYAVEDLRKFNDIRDKVLEQNKKLFFCKPKPSEFNWHGSSVYETYCFGGLLDEFLKVFKFPRDLAEWSTLIHDIKPNVCFEYLLFKKFEKYEKDYLILGTLKSMFLDSKIDLVSNSNVSGVYYNLTNEHQPVIFMCNDEEDDVEFRLFVGGWYKKMKMEKHTWYYELFDLNSHDNANIRIEKYVKNKLSAFTVELVSKENIKEKKKYKTIRFN